MDIEQCTAQVMESCCFLVRWEQIGSNINSTRTTDRRTLHFNEFRSHMDIEQRAKRRMEFHRFFCGWEQVGGGAFRENLHLDQFGNYLGINQHR